MNVRQSVAFGTLALLAACGGDSTGLKSKLSSDEAVAIAMALNSQAMTAGEASASSANRLPSTSGGGISFNVVPQPVTASIDIPNAPCPLGGTNHLTFSLNATVDDATQSMTADMTGTQAPAACGFKAKQVDVFVTGTPSLTHTVHLAIENGMPKGAQTSTLKGSFDFTTSDDRSGSCTVDWSTEVNYTTLRVKVNGTFCGSTFHYDGPLQGQL